MTTNEHRSVAEPTRVGDGAGDSEATGEWEVAKTLLSAQDRTTKAFERHLLAALYDEEAGDAAEIEALLSQAIDDHERIIEDLKAARAAVRAD